ncbi:hypothetical protein DITRI_Ditri15bG0099800 [Diplodiscus trichospermus]
METQSEEIVLQDKEETDLLVRSNKKVKTHGSDEDFARDIQRSRMEDSERDDTMPRRKVSCKDVVLEKNRLGFSATPCDAMDEVVSDDEMDEVEEDKECPTVRVSFKEKRRLRSQWSKALIIKLIGHTVGFNFLTRRLRALWQIKYPMEVIDVGNDAYVVHLSYEEEYERALFNGPWTIADHYLAVQKWFHDFDPHNFCLPLIGNPLRVDQTTLSTARGRFARLCVEIDLSKPLLAKFRLRKKIRRIEYESMHTICFNCGRYGHRQDSCAENTSTVDEGQEEQEAPPQVERLDLDAEIPANYGKWMLVQRKPRKRGNQNDMNTPSTKFMQNKDNGSRFDILSASQDMTSGRKSNVAAAKEFHILVRGNNQNQKVTRTPVSDYVKMGQADLGLDVLNRHHVRHFNNPLYPHQPVPDEHNVGEIDAPNNLDNNMVDNMVTSSRELNSPNIQ